MGSGAARSTGSRAAAVGTSRWEAGRSRIGDPNVTNIWAEQRSASGSTDPTVDCTAPLAQLFDLLVLKRKPMAMVA